MQRGVEQLDMIAQVEIFVGLHRLLQDPIVVMAVKDGDFGHDTRAFERRSQQLDLFADLADFLERAAVGLDMVRHHRAEKFFKTDA